MELAAILAARQAIRPFITYTPLIHSPFLSERSGANVWLKLENQQPTGSFKVRGALHKILQLSPDQRARRIVTASAGNHALGVAHAVRALQQQGVTLTADIFVPHTAPAAKIDKLRRYPVTVHPVGATFDAAHAAADAFAQEMGVTPLSAYDDEDVIAGQGTVGLEIALALPHVNTIVTPVGGGGLLAGVATAVHHMLPRTRVVGVQPEASPAALLSLRDGVAYDPYDHEPTIADGLAGGFGATPLALLQAYPPTIMLASEAETRRAIFHLVQQHQLLIEPSGAIAITPLLPETADFAGQTVVCILSGGNLDTQLLAEVLISNEH